jgi:hypothetical protein
MKRPLRLAPLAGLLRAAAGCTTMESPPATELVAANPDVLPATGTRARIWFRLP